MLAVGNYLNGKGFRGGASGFKLSMITEIADIKSQDKKRSVLIFILEKLETDKNIDLWADSPIQKSLDESYEVASRIPVS